MEDLYEQRYLKLWSQKLPEMHPYVRALLGKPVEPKSYHAPMPNLYLLVTAKQKRFWKFRYSRPDITGVTEMRLGPHPQVSEAEAIVRCDELRKLVANGIDPQAEKRRKRGEKVTFADAAAAWIDLNKGAWSASSLRNAKLLLHHHGKPLARKPISRIHEDMIQSALKPLWVSAPGQARRALAMWENVFDYAKAKKMYLGDNPARWKGLHEHLSPKQPSGDRPHHPSLPYAEMPRFVRSLRQGRGTGPVALEFTILTACRTSEVLEMKWQEVDMDQRLWTIPGCRMKAGRQHRVPLTDRAMELLARRREQTNGEFVFTGYRPAEALARKTMLMLLRSMGARETVHGFRTSFSGWAHNETDAAHETIEQSIAHVVGNKVSRAYFREDSLDKRRLLMGSWAKFCASECAL